MWRQVSGSVSWQQGEEMVRGVFRSRLCGREVISEVLLLPVEENLLADAGETPRNPMSM